MTSFMCHENMYEICDDNVFDGKSDHSDAT